jgi:hypothetical protein
VVVVVLVLVVVVVVVVAASGTTVVALTRYILTVTGLSSYSTMALQPNVGHGLLILDVSISQTTTQHSR